MAQAARGMGERRIESLMSGIPRHADADAPLNGTPAVGERAMAYVRSIWPDALPGELSSSRADFLLAEQAEACHEKCPGVRRCPNKGFRPSALCEPGGDGRKLFLVRWGRCNARAAMDSMASAERALACARLPERLRHCTFSTYLTTNLAGDILKAKGMAMAALSDGNSLILAGSSGVGKTHLAAAMVNGRIESGKAALFISVPELLDDLRKAISTGRSTDAMDTVKKSEFLALDDLGAERLTEWVGERLYMIVNHRYLNGLQTVITTNSENAAELVLRLGDQGQRIVSRLVEIGTWCGIRAEDFRFMRKVAEEKGSGQAKRTVKPIAQPAMAEIPF